MRERYSNMGDIHYNVSERQVWKWRGENIACFMFIIGGLWGLPIGMAASGQLWLALEVWALITFGGPVFLLVGYGLYWIWEKMWGTARHDESNDFIYGPGPYSDDQ